MWRVNLPWGVKRIPNPRLTPRIVFPSWQVTGTYQPIPVDLNVSAAEQKSFVDGDPVGSSFSDIAVPANFPGFEGLANFYHQYLENAYNNYFINMSAPHGPRQRVWRWHDAGTGGGHFTATNGRSIWSQSGLGGPSSAPSTRRYPFVWLNGVLNGYSSTRVSLWDSQMFGRLAMGFANVRASTRVLILVLVQGRSGHACCRLG